MKCPFCNTNLEQITIPDNESTLGVYYSCYEAPGLITTVTLFTCEEGHNIYLTDKDLKLK